MAFNHTQLKEAHVVRVAPVAGKAPSILPAGKKWQLVWNDEFDGNQLDESKWNFRTTFWGYESPTFTDRGVEVSGGTLKIHMVREGDDFLSAHLQTGSLTFDIPRDPDAKGFWPFGQKQEPKFMHRFGYYEIRCKLPKKPGWHAAFWLQSPSIGAHPNPKYAGVECDIMENYNQHTTGDIVCGCGWNGYGKESKWYGHFSFPYAETNDGWHYYGVDWSREGYIFYADGQEVGRQMAPECPVSEVDQFVLVSTECAGYNRTFENADGAGRPTLKKAPDPRLFEAYPDCFEVDFVRVYDEMP